MFTHLRGWPTALLAALALTVAGAAPAATPHEIPAQPQRTPATAPPPARPLPAAAPRVPARPLPASVDGGSWRSGHLQGMALDRARRHLYFSFTDRLVKTDLSGRPLGSVRGIGGHLGDLDLNSADGRVYGSLEYGEDAAFYIAVFDGRRISRMDMDARTSGVLTTVHLREVARDFTADMDGDGVFDGNTGRTADHRYGNAGIDGVAFGPGFGAERGPQKLTVAYGVYADPARRDNDHQVLLQYDVRDWERYERPLDEARPHRSGPAGHDGKFFVYTGNTTYGVQNLEYDGHSGNWLMAVYKGTKRRFPNYGLFAVDGSRPPVAGEIRGQRRPERGMLLSLLPQGLRHTPSGTYGWHAPGQFGLVSLDDGRFYVGESTKVRGGTATQSGRALLHRWTGRTPMPFTALTGSVAATG
ncbi:hypothetical protein J7E88_03035 [Streptomyces sp. ISL-10]|uniref:hypothetical protein n=1 Tax=Streptomyces sp. ISL-10 TaxID=2819172 RepID=UPI001BE8B740|nr:hypothetical protein [Streptomyces sp. ISL-10]MBT2364330.1 hypothetical protein [Streptomyces sp. ISL-10]